MFIHYFARRQKRIRFLMLLLIWWNICGSPISFGKVAYAQSANGLKFPVVADSPISGYLDHKRTDLGQPAHLIQFYDGKANPNSSAGFLFTCSNPSSTDWVGCLDNANGENNCLNSRELWYEDHKGVDFEYFPNWHTGGTCNPSQFTSTLPEVFAAAKGYVEIKAHNDYNGDYLVINHDLNRDGNTGNDNNRVFYIHFVVVRAGINDGSTVEEGEMIGIGGMEGLAWTPHLHFEVQRYFNGVTNAQPVDPFGWTSSESDPYTYPSGSLWSYQGYAPMIFKSCGNNCLVTTY